MELRGRFGELIRGERGLDSRVPVYASYAALPAAVTDGMLAAVRANGAFGQYVYDAVRGMWVGASGLTPVYDSGRLSGSQASINIPDIPQFGKALKVVTRLQYGVGTGGWNPALCRFNGDGSAVYDRAWARETGSSSHASIQANNESYGYLGFHTNSTDHSGNSYAADETIIPDYADTNGFKASATHGFMSYNLVTNGPGVLQCGTLWRSEAAINRIELFGDGASFTAGSRVLVYVVN